METILNNNTTWGVEADKLNTNFNEILPFRDSFYDINAFIVNDDDDQYAHEAQILIERIGGKSLMLVIYRADKSSETESDLTGHIYLRAFDLGRKTLLVTLDLFYPGLEAGVTVSADSRVWLGRMYISGTNLICYANNGHTLYTRTIDITSSDASSWTAGNISIAQMTMNNADGVPTLSNVTAANIQTHLENVLGDTNADYNDNVPFFRNLDKICLNGATWVATLEVFGTNAKNIVVTSTDSGASWTLGALINYTTSSRTNQMEMSLVYSGATLYAIARTDSGIVFLSSANNGATWSTNTAITGCLASKPVAINYYNDAGTKGIILAINRTSEITENNYRTTLGIYTTTDFVTLTEVAKIVSHSYVHYPTLCHFSRALYVGYSKGLRFNTDGEAVTTSNRNAIAVTRIY